MYTLCMRVCIVSCKYNDTKYSLELWVLVSSTNKVSDG